MELVREPICQAFREEIIGENSFVKETDDCPNCLIFRVRCPVSFHPSAGNTFSFLHIDFCCLFHTLSMIVIHRLTYRFDFKNICGF